MDYWSRIILATIIGVGIGLGINHLLGSQDYLAWALGCTGVALATETSLRTIKNVGAPPNPVLDRIVEKPETFNSLPRQKPKKPNF
ncbi:MAG: hypothetical protein WC675_04890 [Patescibacteria group bacterium]|jgi:hypothetical protein